MKSFKMDFNKNNNIASILGILSVVLIRFLGGGLVVGIVVGIIIYVVYGFYIKSRKEKIKKSVDIKKED